MYSYEMESNRKVWTTILRTINRCNKIYIHLNGPQYIYIWQGKGIYQAQSIMMLLFFNEKLIIR
jgi:hypothetical protein